MKTIKEKRQICVPKEEEIELFETIDGKKFKSEKEATEYEEIIIKKRTLEEKYKIKNIIIDDYGVDYNDNLTSSKLCYIENLNDETINDLICIYPYLGYEGLMILMIKKIKIGWNFFIETEYDSNFISRWGGYNLNIYSLEDVIKEKKEQLKKLNEIL
jgi:hypothetical protein